MSTRDVIFQLTAAPHPQLKAQLTSFVQTARAAQDEIRKAESDTAAASIITIQKRKEAERATTADIETLRNQSASFEVARQQKAKDNFARLEAEKVRIAQAAQKAIADTESMLSKGGAALNPEEKAKLRVDIEKRAAAEIEKIDRQISAAKAREADKATRAQEASVKKALREAENAVAQEIKARENATKTVEAMRDKHRAAMREVYADAADVGDSIMKIGRGFVALGLVGERDLKKVQDRLLGMQATFDLVSGSIQTFLKITKMIDGMRQATIAATLAQEALNASQARGAVAGAAGAAAGGARGAGGLLAAGAAGAVGSAGASAVAGGGAAGAGSAIAGIAAPIAAAAAAVGGALMGAAGIIGSARAAMENGIGGGARAGSWTESIGGASWNPFGMIIAANERVESNASAKNAEEAAKRLTQAQQVAERRSARIAELSPIVGQRLARDRADWDAMRGASMEQLGNEQGGRQTEFDAGEARRNKAARDAFAALQSERVALASQAAKKGSDEEVKAAENASKRIFEIDREIAEKRQEIQRDREAAQGSNIEDRRAFAQARVAKEIADEEARIRDYRAEAEKFDEGSALRADFTKAAEESEKRIVALLGQQRDVERQAGQERRAAAEESLRFSEQELETARARADAARDSLLSAKERFGLLDSGKQAELVGLSRRARAGQQLTPEELRELQGVGLESTNELVRRQALARAEAGGFGQIAAEDERRAKELQAAQDKLAVQVDDKRQIVVNVAQDTDRLVKKMTDALAVRVAQADQELIARFTQAIDEIRQLRQSVLNGAGRG